jgi:hypothetical protein
VTREQLAHLLRSAAQIADESDVVVIGSQSILGTYAEDELPAQAVASLEADLAFFDDDDNAKSDSVDAHIGEESRFHDTFGYYGQGVSISTAILPAGWRDRIVLLENDLTAPGRGLCLDRHDLVVSKLVAGREKDFGFAWALIEAGLVDAEVLVERAEMLETVPAVQRRVRRWIDSCVKQLAARRDSDR